MLNNIEQRAFPVVSTVIPFPETTQAPRATQAQSSAPNSPAPVSPPPQRKTGLAADLADKENLKSLGHKLQQIASQLGKEATPQVVLAALGSTPLDIHPESSYADEAGDSVTLETFIKKILGLPLPSSYFHLTGLAFSVTNRAMESSFGNLGGALSWPVPLSTDEQHRLRAITLNQEHALGDKPLVAQTKGGVLEFLRYQQSIATGPRDEPAKILQALISTPQAQLMGKDLQERMQGILSDTSGTDYLLAGIALQLDPESITAPHRNQIAGFDLASRDHWGKPASVVIDGLTQWLSDKGKTTAELAKVGAYLLLAGRAPVYLIKDIPDSIKYGSHAWVDLAVAAATIEARTPGKILNMTFAQVMLEAESASLMDPNVTRIAQREALIDWGKVNGLPSDSAHQKDDYLYTADELATLVTAFNARRTEMAVAAEAFEMDIPSRKEMARAVLKERFPELETLFEERLIHVSRKETDSVGRVRYSTVEVGPHSLLDIAMMDLCAPNLVFTSDDQRIPVTQLNANHRFGVRDAFESEFKTIIEKKKQGTQIYIKHLISQLPVEDRKNFQFGTITFYQQHSRTLGTGFIGSTNHGRNESLLVKIERDGVTSEYKIDFNAGLIQAVSAGKAAPRHDRQANLLHETKVFQPAGADTLLEPERAPASGAPGDTFASSRVQLIADAFVEHINFDDKALKQQALGQTTADKNHTRADAVNEFLLDLIPFRSAINNFRAGNIGAGALDLGLDLFGFLTAGVGTAGKVFKIAGTTASRLVKGARAAKAIGMATISTLNPLGGLGDLSIGTWNLAVRGKKAAIAGLKRLGAIKASPDLVEASKRFDATSIGTFKHNNVVFEDQAVLISDKWYAYNPATRQPYGWPLENFVPSAHMHTDDFGKWATAKDNTKKIDDATINNWKATVARHRTGPGAQAFAAGYEQGNIQRINGLSKSSKIEDLMKLANDKTLTAEQVGILTRRYDDIAYEVGRAGSARFIDTIEPRFGTVTPMPQVIYLTMTKQLSDGQCAALSRVMATAVEHGKEQELIRNMYKAAAFPKDPASIGFMEKLKKLQNQVGNQTSFYAGKPHRQVTYQTMVKELGDATASKSLMIDSPGHAMAAGVKVNGDEKVFYFYDPNYGHASFSSADAMESGLARLFNDKKLGPKYKTHAVDRNALEFKVFDHDSEWPIKNSVLPADVEALYNAPISS